MPPTTPRSPKNKLKVTPASPPPLPPLFPGTPVTAPGPNLSRPLSGHFTLKEMLRSTTAERDEPLKREQENPPVEVVTSLQYRWSMRSNRCGWEFKRRC
jgi:hypothetical protein